MSRRRRLLARVRKSDQRMRAGLAALLREAAR